MRILYVITLSELGGAQSVVVNLANGMCNEHEVYVAAGEGDDKMFELLNPLINKIKIKHLIRKISPLSDLKASLELFRLNQKLKPDIIHLHSSKAGFLGRLVFPKNKTIYTIHGFDSIRIAHRRLILFERLLQYRCKTIVAVSEYDKNNLIDEKISNNLITIYNGITKPIPLHINPFMKYESDYLGSVLCIARLSYPKNHKLFIEVAKRLPEYRFIWIGNQKSPSFDYPSNVSFLGNIQSAGSYIAYADLFFLPSYFEGLPIVIIEALASGIPVVASDVGGVSEMLNGKNGEAVQNNIELMANIIQKWFNLSPIEREKSRIAALNSYNELFNSHRMIQQYRKVYEL